MKASGKCFFEHLDRLCSSDLLLLDRGYAKLGELGYYHTAVAERGVMQVAEAFLPIIHLVFSNLKT